METPMVEVVEDIIILQLVWVAKEDTKVVQDIKVLEEQEDIPIQNH